jgi:hypothetical protein
MDETDVRYFPPRVDAVVVARLIRFRDRAPAGPARQARAQPANYRGFQVADLAAPGIDRPAGGRPQLATTTACRTLSFSKTTTKFG